MQEPTLRTANLTIVSVTAVQLITSLDTPVFAFYADGTYTPDLCDTKPSLISCLYSFIPHVVTSVDECV